MQWLAGLLLATAELVIAQDGNTTAPVRQTTMLHQNPVLTYK